MAYARAGAICVCKLRQEDDIGFLQMTQTAKACVSKKRSFLFAETFAVTFRVNALLRPADFFDSLRCALLSQRAFCFIQLYHPPAQEG